MKAEVLPGEKGDLPMATPLIFDLAGSGPVDEQSRPMIPSVIIGPDYFRTLGATLVSGREFNNVDGSSGVPAVIVNQRFASLHWPGKDAWCCAEQIQ